MCGIFAHIHRGKLSDVELKKIHNYFLRITHRGPDHTSFVILERDGFTVYLGFHRLAIIDPSPEADPLLQDDDVYLVCNGEIYNYKYLIDKYSLVLRTGSDCEVILQLYKQYPERWPSIIEEFDGDFAFVLYDHKKGLILTSRDRMGVRPLYQACNNTDFTFASEGKATYLDNVAQFTPGVFKMINLAESEQDWAISQQAWVKSGKYFNTSYKTAQTIMRELFIDAVKKRLMADRPIGFLVSGGLDSSLVAAVAQRILGTRISTFSIGLPNSPDLLAARTVAEYLGSDHHEVVISTEDITNVIPDVVYQNESYDITTTRASIPMYLLSKYIRENTDIKVIFSGEGADELLGGYLYFHKAPGCQEFQDDTVRLMSELYKFDVLRGDRSTAAWGLEIRVPFLDADFISYVTHIDPAHKMPRYHGIEKSIMRTAFDGYLPATILYRQKEAFSDGIGYNSVTSLKEYASQNKVCEPLSLVPNTAHPETDEAMLYYKLFLDNYATNTGLYTQYYWLPKWNGDVKDPSATVLTVHNRNT